MMLEHMTDCKSQDLFSAGPITHRDPAATAYKAAAPAATVAIIELMPAHHVIFAGSQPHPAAGLVQIRCVTE